MAVETLNIIDAASLHQSEGDELPEAPGEG